MPWLWAIIVLAAILLVATGSWRSLFWLVAIRPRRMTIAGLGLAVEPGPDTQRVDAILAHFAGGFNQMLTARSESSWRAAVSTVTPLFQPFSEEGVAMGYTPRRFFRFDPNDFETRLVKSRPEFRYLYYVGLGFWSGMRNHSVARLMRITERLDLMHRFLAFDGYGFKIAFFDHPRDPRALHRLDALPGYARNAAFQGVGRALYFRYMSEPERLIEAIRALGIYAPDAAAGVGLASVFVNVDRLDTARSLAAKMPDQWHPHVSLGMCFALKARAINDVEAFDRWMTVERAPVRDAVYAAVRECDRVELLVRDEFRSMYGRQIPSAGEDRSYQAWRERVTSWMTSHIDFPLAGVSTFQAGKQASKDTITPTRQAGGFGAMSMGLGQSTS